MQRLSETERSRPLQRLHALRLAEKLCCRVGRLLEKTKHRKHDKIIHNRLMFMHSIGRKISTQIKKTINLFLSCSIMFYLIPTYFYKFRKPMGFLAHPPFTGLGHVLPKATPSTASMCTTRMATSQTLGLVQGNGIFLLAS